MTTNATEMATGVQANPQWKACNGGVYYVLDAKQSFRGPVAGTPAKGWRNDYVRRGGWFGRRHGLGPIGWRFVVPYDPTATYSISLASDGSETALTNPPTLQHPPAGVK
jgi:hypothetical protein